MENCNLSKSINIQLYSPKDGKFSLEFFESQITLKMQWKLWTLFLGNMLFCTNEIWQFHFKMFKDALCLAHLWTADKDLLLWCILSFFLFPHALTYAFFSFLSSWLSKMILFTWIDSFVMSKIWGVSWTSVHLHQITLCLIQYDQIKCLIF